MSKIKRKSARIETPAPAPGELNLLQVFANTNDLKAKRDALATPRHLSDWLARWDLVPAGTQLTAADLERAWDARAGVRGLVAANCGAALLEEVVGRLDRASRGARPQVRFHLDGSSHFKSESFDEALGLLLGLVVASRLAGVWHQFKMCANSQCRAVYYDFSNKRTTKWCTRRCGDLMRARTYRRNERLYASALRRIPQSSELAEEP